MTIRIIRTKNELLLIFSWIFHFIFIFLHQIGYIRKKSAQFIEHNLRFVTFFIIK